MKKRIDIQTLPQIDPLDVLVALRRRGRRQVYYAKKFHRSRAAITNAFNGESKLLLYRIAKDLDVVQ